MRLPSKIFIREVSPRDGLQSEEGRLPTDDKVILIDLLSRAGFKRINVTAFSSPKVVPQLADAAEVAARIGRVPGVIYDATVPNLIGAKRAIDSGLDAITVFVSASDGGSRANVGVSTEEALNGAEQSVAAALSAGLGVVATISKAFGSAYDGAIDPTRVLAIADRLVAVGARAIALGDTSGEAAPLEVSRLVGRMLERYPHVELSLHFHDTRGLALANVLAAMDAGATHFDSAVGGIGGSPFTPNSAGNVATEDLVHMCEESGVGTGVDIDIVLEAYAYLETKLGHPLPGRLGQVGRSKTVSA